MVLGLVGSLLNVVFVDEQTQQPRVQSHAAANTSLQQLAEIRRGGGGRWTYTLYASLSDSAAAATWGKDLKSLCLWTGKVWDLCVQWGGGWGWSLFMLPHYQLLILAEGEGVCNMVQACTCAMATAVDSSSDLEHTLAVFVDETISSRVCGRRRAGTITLRSFTAWATEVKVWWGHGEMEQGKHLSDNVARAMSERDTPTSPHHLAIVSTLSPSYCFRTVSSGWIDLDVSEYRVG